MKRYKLLKDLPTFKAGGLFYISEYGALVYDDGGFGVMAYAQSTLEKFPNILTEWFEEIEEPTDSAHWKPEIAEKYFYINEYGDVEWEVWNDDDLDNRLMAMGLVYRTEEECEKAKERRLAKVRLEQTSNFEPDLNNGKLGWIVGYSCHTKRLIVERFVYSYYGETIHYKTAEDAKKSIKENEQDWKIYFGIK